MTYQPKVYKTDGGDKIVVASGGTMDVESGGYFKIAGTAVTPSAAELNTLTGVTATAAELNLLDLSAKTVTVAEAAKLTGITAAARVVKITGGTGFTGLVLPVPTAAEVGMVKQITLDTLTSGSVAMTITNIAIGGTAATTATFDAAGETLVLVGMVYGTTYRWGVIGEIGVTLS